MFEIKLVNLSIAGVVIRFYVAMAVALVLGFMGQFVLMAFLAGPIAASAIVGMSIRFKLPQRATEAKTKRHPAALPKASARWRGNGLSGQIATAK